MLCRDAVHDKDRVQYSICREDRDDMCLMNVKVSLPSSHVHIRHKCLRCAPSLHLCIFNLRCRMDMHLHLCFGLGPASVVLTGIHCYKNKHLVLFSITHLFQSNFRQVIAIQAAHVCICYAYVSKCRPVFVHTSTLACPESYEYLATSDNSGPQTRCDGFCFGAAAKPDCMAAIAQLCVRAVAEIPAKASSTCTVGDSPLSKTATTNGLGNF